MEGYYLLVINLLYNTFRFKICEYYNCLHQHFRSSNIDYTL